MTQVLFVWKKQKNLILLVGPNGHIIYSQKLCLQVPYKYQLISYNLYNFLYVLLMAERYGLISRIR